MSSINKEGFELSPQQKITWVSKNTEHQNRIECCCELKKNIDNQKLLTAFNKAISFFDALSAEYHLPKGFKFPLQYKKDVAEVKYFDSYDSLKNCTADDLLVWIAPGNGKSLHVSAPIFIADYYSLCLLIKAALSVYENQELLIEEAVSYFNYSSWRNELIKEGDADSTAFWKKYKYNTARPEACSFLKYKFAGRPPVYKTFNLPLSSSAETELFKAARNKSTNPGTFILSAWYLLMSLHAQGSPVTIGVQQYNRENEELADIVGNVTNILPVNFTFSKESTFKELWQECIDTLNNVNEWIDFNDHSVNGSAADLLSKFNFGFEYFSVPDLHALVNEVSFSGNGNYFPVKLSVFDNAEKIKICLTIDTNATLARSEFLPEHFDSLLKKILQNIDLPVETASNNCSAADLDLYKKTEGKTVDIDETDWLSLFDSSATSFPHKTAVFDQENQLTYEQLSLRSAALAAEMQEKYGIANGDRVAIYGQRTIHFIVAMIAIHRSGAVIVPIDISSPLKRIEYILENSNCKLLIKFTAEKTHNTKIKELDISDFTSEKVKSPAVLKDKRKEAYILYTSGTTGVPKGVLVGHESLVNYVNGIDRHINVTENDTCALLTSLSFDLGYSSLFCSLTRGAALCLVGENLVNDPEKLAAYLISKSVSLIKITPSLLEVIAETNAFKQGLAESNLRLIMQGGELMNHRLTQNLIEKKKSLVVLNHYGPTETTIGVSAYAYTNNSDFEKIQRQIIGQPIQNVDFLILDKEMNTVPVGMPGDLYIGGKALALEYIGNSELSKRKFVALKNKKSARYYNSGDKARLLPSGYFEFLGRTDEQIKIRGYRVEPEEIENKFLAHEHVKQAAVIADRSENNILLVAFIITLQDSATNWKEWLKDYLPEYMIPDFVHSVSAIPVTANGKMDKKALLEIHEERRYKVPFIPPATEAQRQVALIWEEVLGVTNIGLHDNFFSSGGDSIKALRSVILFNKIFNAVEVKDIYDCANLEEMAALAESKRKLPASASVHKNIFSDLEKKTKETEKDLAFKGVDAVYPIGEMQLGMIYYTELQKNSGIYHDQNYFQTEVSFFDKMILEQALKLLVQKHEVLRSAFYLNLIDVPVQVIHSYTQEFCKIHFSDLSGMSEDAQKQQIELYNKKDRSNPLNLSKAETWRLAVFLLGNNGVSVVWTSHHAITDGWSNASFAAELFETCNLLQKNKDHTPKKIAARYGDFVTEQESYKRNESILGFWKKELQNFKRTSLPWQADTSKTGNQYETRLLVNPIPGSTLKNIEQLAKKMNLDLQDIYLSAFLCVLKVTCNTTDLTVGIICNARPQVEDGDKLLGCFVNAIPFRFNFRKSATLAQIIKGVSEQRLKLRGNDRLPFAIIKNFVSEETHMVNPLFDIQYNFMDFHVLDEAAKNSSGRSLGIMGYSKDNSLFDFEIKRSRFGTDIIIQVPEKLFDEGTVIRFKEYFINTLNSFTDTIDAGFANSFVHQEHTPEILKRKTN
ncbi:MAG: amino acid adenylation domain-containing protein, partial [Bacteroidia bacterium]|nr:amino acid adenylation domain-containing protein [Bacteroidia bacterium]